ncbi:MAG TPA: hypothetical protein VKA70_04145 [Blastocatellia bacterium]|nr:hypothetical protein [Blastocatellia bacterium]
MIYKKSSVTGRLLGPSFLLAIFLLAAVWPVSNSLIKVKAQTPQAIATIDVNLAPLTVLGASEKDELSGNGAAQDFDDFPRAHAVATGDFNKDGTTDIAIGAPEVDFTPTGGVTRDGAGAAYIIFGNPSFPNPTVKDAATDPEIKVFGASANDNLGFSLAVRDVNGDNTDDLLIGAPGVNFPSTGDGARNDNGAVFIIFGSDSSTPRTIDLNTANAANVAIFGERSGDRFGSALAAGDVGGATAAAELVVGAPGSTGPLVSSGRTNGGAAFLFFGGTPLANTTTTTKIIDLGSTTAGAQTADVKIYGKVDSRFGSAIAIGDLNAGGSADIAIGAPLDDRPASPAAINETGAVYLVFGGTNLNPAAGQTSKTIDIAATQQQASIYGIDAQDHFGASVAIGDVTVDGAVDLIAGAPDADGPANGRDGAGEAYLLTGGTRFNPVAPATEQRIDIGPGNLNLTVFGSAANDHLGATVAAGQVNIAGSNDTITDMLVGVPGFDHTGRANSGATLVFFGGASLTFVLSRDLALGQDDVRVVGQAAGDELGWAITTGDVNKDRGGDLIVGAPFANVVIAPAPSREDAGKVYALLAAAGDIPPLNAPPDVTLTDPDGGETLSSGSTFPITWTATDANGNDTIQRFELRLSTDAGTTFNTVIAPNVIGTARSFQWDVPPGLNTATARVRIIAFDTAGGQDQDDSNGNFTITDSTVTVQSPNGGETFNFGQTVEIRWIVPAALEPQIAGFDVFLSTNSGGTFNIPIAFQGPNNPALPAGARTLNWSITGASAVCTSTARIQVAARLLNGTTSLDQSNANFSIGEPGPTIDTGAINLTTNNTRLSLRTTQPAVGNEVRFIQGVMVEISTTQDGSTFVMPNKIKFKGSGRKISTKGSFGDVSLNDLIPEGAIRTLRVKNPTCGITTIRVRRVGSRLEPAPQTPQSLVVWQ